MEKVHVYVRDDKGKFVTHFLVEEEIYKLWEAAAKAENMTLSEFVNDALRRALKEEVNTKVMEDDGG